jgi:hypothetical protein
VQKDKNLCIIFIFYVKYFFSNANYDIDFYCEKNNV